MELAGETEMADEEDAAAAPAIEARIDPVWRRGPNYEKAGFEYAVLVRQVPNASRIHIVTAPACTCICFCTCFLHLHLLLHLLPSECDGGLLASMCMAGGIYGC